MAQLRSRNAKAKKPAQSNIKKAVQKKSASNMKSIVQTFVAKDDDVKTVKKYPKSQLERSEFINIKTGKRVTPFQYKVYDLVLQIPEGQVTSYKVLSDTLKSAPRAVGQALRQNPFCPLPVPCHRVIATDYSLGGFGGGSGDHQNTADKKAKLETEGCVFEDHYMYGHDKNGSKEFFKDFVIELN
ncbi:Ribosome-interacting GTPase 2 [Mucor velutinosus]|uniref:Methylated-DNA--protein-cysteine methyltransferase n=1 Tax=Mucor velutinosus TaxID=708070 RepID=A0AAN7DBE1_9FUNG|nr:Ribosome-interacting GTPase 2 [Mucor velutinosus]